MMAIGGPSPMAFRQGVIASGYTVIVVGVACFAFLAGMVVMAVFMASRERPPELWEIGPELRQEVDRDFADYNAGKIIYAVILPLLDTRIKARVVKRYRNADHGFVPISELGSMPTHLWYYQSGTFGLWKYNNDFLFVIIRERYAHELDRNSSESKAFNAPQKEER
jgi:hypothetical protein